MKRNTLLIVASILWFLFSILLAGIGAFWIFNSPYRRFRYNQLIENPDMLMTLSPLKMAMILGYILITLAGIFYLLKYFRGSRNGTTSQ